MHNSTVSRVDAINIFVACATGKKKDIPKKSASDRDEY